VVHRFDLTEKGIRFLKARSGGKTHCLVTSSPTPSTRCHNGVFIII
jgi:hypothetical protein